MTPPPPPAGPPNPFAIPMHRRPRDTGKLVVDWDPGWPLVPWSVRGHDELFALVDDLAAQIRRFREEGPQRKVLLDTEDATGHLVVVSGGDGSGKTSLIHYCVHDLVRRLAPGHREDAPAEPWGVVSLPPDVKVVDVAGKRNDDDSISRRDGQVLGVREINRNIYEEALDILRRDPVFRRSSEEAGHQALNSAELQDCYKGLSRLLVDLGWTAIIIVPNIPWRDGDLTRRFLRACANYSRPGVVFFVEITNTTLRQLLIDEFGRRGKSHITHLAIGALRDADCSKFIEKRLNAVAGNLYQFRVTDEAVHSLRADVDYGCVWELQSFFYGVAEGARQDGVGVIDRARLLKYRAAQEDAQHESFIREPRAGEQGPSQ